MNQLPSERIQEILKELRTKRTGNYDELSLAPTINDAILVYLYEGCGTTTKEQLNILYNIDK